MCVYIFFLLYTSISLVTQLVSLRLFNVKILSESCKDEIYLVYCNKILFKTISQIGKLVSFDHYISSQIIGRRFHGGMGVER